MDRSIDRRTRALTAHRRPANSIPECIDRRAHLKLMPERAARNRAMVNIAHWAPQQLSSTRRFDQTVIKPAS
jgi:hypothetical protein